MNTMGLNWFSTRTSKREKKTNEAVTRAIEARVTVTNAANRLMEALDIAEGSRMGLTLENLVKARQGKR